MGDLDDKITRRQLREWEELLALDVSVAGERLANWLADDLKTDRVMWKFPEPTNAALTHLMLQVVERIYELCQTDDDDFKFTDTIEKRLDKRVAILIRGDREAEDCCARPLFDARG